MCTAHRYSSYRVLITAGRSISCSGGLIKSLVDVYCADQEPRGGLLRRRVAMDDGAGDVLPDAGWFSAAIDCKARGVAWLRPTASGASVLAYSGAEHSTVGFEDGVHFLSVDVEGRATPAKLVRDGIAWAHIASDSIAAMAPVSDVDGEGLLLAGANALHLLSVSVSESGGEAVHSSLSDLLVRHADATGASAELLQGLQTESIQSLRQRCISAGLDVVGACGRIDTVVYANSRQDYGSQFGNNDTIVTMDALGQRSAIGGDTGSIAVLDLKRPEAAPVMSSHESFCVNAVALVDGNDTELASVCSGGLLKVWDWRQRAVPVLQLSAPAQETASLTCVAVRPQTGGTQMVTGSARGVVALWDRRAPDHPISVFRPHEELVWDMCFDEMGSSLITCSNDGTVAEHEVSMDSHGAGDMAQMCWVRRLVEQVMPVNCVAIDQASGRVAAGTDGNALYFTARHGCPHAQPAGAATASFAARQGYPGQQHQDYATVQQTDGQAVAATTVIESGSSKPEPSLPPPQATPFGISPVIGSSGQHWGDWSAAPGARSAISTTGGPLFTPAQLGFGGKLF